MNQNNEKILEEFRGGFVRKCSGKNCEGHFEDMNTMKDLEEWLKKKLEQVARNERLRIRRKIKKKIALNLNDEQINLLKSVLNNF